MVIKQIVSFDEASGEADLLLSDGKNELLCYCQLLWTPTPTDAAMIEIETFGADGIVIADSREEKIEKTDDGFFSYRLQGRVTQTVPPEIAIGGLRITLDKPLPKDIKQGDFVALTAPRLDCLVDELGKLCSYIKTEFPAFPVVYENGVLSVPFRDDFAMKIRFNGFYLLYFNDLFDYDVDEQDIREYVKEILSDRYVFYTVKRWRKPRLKVVPKEQYKDAPRVLRAWTIEKTIK